jgi:hypothetical protein
MALFDLQILKIKSSWVYDILNEQNEKLNNFQIKIRTSWIQSIYPLLYTGSRSEKLVSVRSALKWSRLTIANARTREVSPRASFSVSWVLTTSETNFFVRETVVSLDDDALDDWKQSWKSSEEVVLKVTLRKGQQEGRSCDESDGSGDGDGTGVGGRSEIMSHGTGGGGWRELDGFGWDDSSGDGTGLSVELRGRLNIWIDDDVLRNGSFIYEWEYSSNWENSKLSIYRASFS